jgi:hypothetical protein
MQPNMAIFNLVKLTHTHPIDEMEEVAFKEPL